MFQTNRFGNTPPVVLNLIIINALMLLMTFVFDGQNLDLTRMLGLYSFYSPNYHWWQFITANFMHANLTHLFFNMFSLWMFGRILEQVWGGKKFLIFYLATGVGAMLLNSLVNLAEVEYARYAFENTLNNLTPDAFFSVLSNHHLTLNPDVEAYLGGWYKDPNNVEYIKQAKLILSQSTDYYIAQLSSIPTVGASGSVYGVLLGFGMLFPNMMIMLLIPPIPMKAKYMVMIFAGIELFLGISGKQVGIAHFAHLGGMLVAFIIIRYWKQNNQMY